MSPEEYREFLKTVKPGSSPLPKPQLPGKARLPRNGRTYQTDAMNQTEARYAGEWLEAIGALDDGAYAAALVRHCGDMGYGPRRAREKLREKGVPQELWDEALDELPPDGEQIDRFLQSKLHGRSPEDKEKKRLTDALLRRGFSWGEVRSAWGRYGSEIWEE